MIELHTDHLRARVLPEIGGCIASLDLILPDQKTCPVLLAPAMANAVSGAAKVEDARQSAHFAMLPYVNRVPGNVIVCDGTPIPMPRNTDEPLALHGAGWNGAWKVDRSGPDHCDMILHAPVGYPFEFRADQRIELSASSLTIRLSMTNTSTGPIPAGLGFHPYFPRDPQTQLQFHADWFWLEGPGHLPTDPIRVPPELDFSKLRLLPATWRANCYTGWSGGAMIIQPSMGYRVMMDASQNLRDLMFYAPPDYAFFALEPQSHTSGYANTDATAVVAKPMTVLQPEQSLVGWVRLDVVPEDGNVSGDWAKI